MDITLNEQKENIGDGTRLLDVTLLDGRILTVTIAKDAQGRNILGQFTREIKNGIRSYILIDGLTSGEIKKFSDAFRDVMKEDKRAYASYIWEELDIEFKHKRMGDIILSVVDVMNGAILLNQVATPDAPYGKIYHDLQNYFDDAKVFFLSWADGPQRPDRFGGPWIYDNQIRTTTANLMRLY